MTFGPNDLIMVAVSFFGAVLVAVVVLIAESVPVLVIVMNSFPAGFLKFKFDNRTRKRIVNKQKNFKVALVTFCC